MLNAKKGTEQDRVAVCQNISEILTSVADLNAFKTLTAIVQRPVLTTSARIHAREFVESTQSAEFKIMLPFVFA